MWNIVYNYNIDVERYGLLTIIFLGEIVVGFLYRSRANVFTTSFIATGFGIFICISLQYIYFTIDHKDHECHAVRKGKLSSLIWQVAHFPLHASILSLGNIMNSIVVNYAHDQEEGKPTLIHSNMRTSFLLAIALILFFFTVEGLMHSPLKVKTRIPFNYRIGIRFIVSLLFIIAAFLPSNLNVPELMASATIALISLCCVLEFGRSKLN